MTEEERDELFRKTLFNAKPRKQIAKVLGEHVKNILTEEERVGQIKEWDEFYAKNPHTGHMPVQLLTLSKSKDGCDK